eukprot:tig00020806_g14044.t1
MSRAGSSQQAPALDLDDSLAPERGIAHSVLAALQALLSALHERPKPRRGLRDNVLLPLLLEVAAWLQFAALALGSGWHASAVGWLRDGVALDRLAARTGPTAAAAALYASAALAATVLLLAAWVGIPCLLPAGRALPSGAACPAEPPLIAGLVAVAGVPLLLLAALPLAFLHFDSDLASPHWGARSHGRAGGLLAAAQAGLVLLRLVVPDAGPAFLAAVLAVAAADFALSLIMQPHVHSRMNELRSGLSAAALWLAVASHILGALPDGTDEAARLAASGLLLALALPAALGGAFLCRFVERRVAGDLQRLAGALFAAAPQPSDMAVYVVEARPHPPRPGLAERATATTRRASAGGEPFGSGPAGAEAGLVASVAPEVGAGAGAREPAAAAEGRHRTLREIREGQAAERRLPVPSLAALLPGFLGEALVDVAARSVLTRTTAADGGLQAAEGIYKAGLRLFPRSAFVLLSHATFRFHCLGELQMAQLDARRASRRVETWLDWDMIVLAAFKQKAWERHDGGGVNFLSMLEFKRSYAGATRAHNEALKNLQSLWGQLAKSKSNSWTKERLALVYRRIAAIHSGKQKANEAYKELARKFPKSKMLLRSYGQFLADVQHDPEMAAMQFARADSIEEQEAAERVGSGGNEAANGKGPDVDAQSDAKKSARSGSSGSSKMARAAAASAQIGSKTLGALRQLRFGIVAQLAVCGLLFAASYAAIMVQFGAAHEAALRLYVSGNIALNLDYTNFYIRDVTLESLLAEKTGDESVYVESNERLKSAIETLELWSSVAYFGGQLEDGTRVPASAHPLMYNYWREPSVLVETLVSTSGPSGGPLFTKERVSPWDATRAFVGHAHVVLYSDVHTDLHEYGQLLNNTHFQYMIRNGPNAITQSVISSRNLAMQEANDVMTKTYIVVGCVLGAALLQLLCVAPLLFRKGFQAVRANQKGVSEVVGRVPVSMVSHIAALYEQMSLVGRDGDSDADVDDLLEREREEEAGARGEGGETARDGAGGATSHRSGSGAPTSTAKPGGGVPAEPPVKVVPLTTRALKSLPAGGPPGLVVSKSEAQAQADRASSRGAVGARTTREDVDIELARREDDSDEELERGSLGREASVSDPGGSGGADADADADAGDDVVPFEAPGKEGGEANSKGAEAAAAGAGEPAVQLQFSSWLHGLISSDGEDSKGGKGGVVAAKPAAASGFINVVELSPRNGEQEDDKTQPSWEPVPAAAAGAAAAPPRNSSLRNRRNPALSLAPRGHSFLKFSSHNEVVEIDEAGQEKARRASYMHLGSGAATPTRAEASGSKPVAAPDLHEALESARKSARGAGADREAGPGEGGARSASKGSRISAGGLGRRAARAAAAAELKRDVKESKAGDRGKEKERTAFSAIERTQLVAAVVYADLEANVQREVVYAGARRYVFLRMATLAREIYVNDGFLAPRHELIDRMHADLREYERLHSGLKYGSTDLGLRGTDGRQKEISDILYEPRACYHMEPEDCGEDRFKPLSLVTTAGADFIAASTFLWAREILAQEGALDDGGVFVGGLRATGGSTALDADYDIRSLYSRSPSLEKLMLLRNEIDDAYAVMLDIFVKDAYKNVKDVGAVEAVILALGLVALVAMYFVLFKGILSRLGDESNRAIQLLQTVPLSCREDLKHIYAFVDKNAALDADADA